MNLKDWCEEYGSSLNKVSNQISVSRQALSLWTLGKRDISVKIADTIRILTNGKVSFLDWL